MGGGAAKNRNARPPTQVPSGGATDCSRADGFVARFRRMSLPRLCLCSLGLLLPLPLAAQQPAPAAAPKNAIRNGGFERTLQTPNLWSGVDKDGFLAGFRGALPVMNESGRIADTPMPVSVAVGDLNGDGLPDLLSSDVLGYMRIYFNSGTKEQPKFTAGELTLPYLALPDGEPPWVPPGLGGTGETEGWRQRWVQRRQGVRINLVDTTRSGKLDIIAGNYFGEIFFIRNTGSPTAPSFAQPQPLARGMLAMTKDPNRRWGNVFAPAMTDWDGDGKPDVLIGEGSYSANNIHLFLNQGSAAAPTLAEDKRQPLALGEGREQLTPALADVNGDGREDVLVADRRGRITAYLRPSAWKAGDTIKPSGFLAKNGGLSPDDAQAYALGSGINTIAAGDLNGDGLFDIVVGKSSGRIALALNKGSKEQPKFESPADLTGDKPIPPSWLLPSQWDIEIGLGRGNFLAYASCVSAQEDPSVDAKEGTRALKFGYAAPANKLLQRPQLASAPTMKFFDRTAKQQGDTLFRASSEGRAAGGPNNFMVMRQLVQLEIGKTYTLSFQARGSKVVAGQVILGWRGFKQVGEDKIVRGERGAVRRQQNSLSERRDETFSFNASGSWATVTKQFKIDFQKERALNDEKLTSEAVVEVSFDLGGPDGFLYIDDFKLEPAS
jgi:hypothetical protein